MALNIAVIDVIAILKNTPGAEVTKAGRIMGKVRKLAKIPMGVLTKDSQSSALHQMTQLPIIKKLQLR